VIVYITRHGQIVPPDRKEGLALPAMDMPLSPLGRHQAQRVGERLKAMGFGGVVYASPFRRASETAHLISEVVGTSFYPETALREIVHVPEEYVGFDGLSLDQLREAFPTVATDATLRHPWWTTHLETDPLVLSRVRPFLERLVAANEEDALLVGHGASMNACIRFFLETRFPDLLPSAEPGWNCALTAIRVKPSVEPLMLGDTAHLKADQITSNAETRLGWQRELEA